MDKTLLLIEDDPFMQELLALYLSEAGWQADVIENGQQAWEWLQAHPQTYQMILLDRDLPGIHGLELLTRIKQHPKLKYIPVILETAEDAYEAVLEGLQAGADYYLPKPINSTQLLEIIESVFANDPVK